MGHYDPREPGPVAVRMIEQLHRHWQIYRPSKPLLLVTQGDPDAPRGISAITRRISEGLNIRRAMVFLEPDIAAYHLPNADRYRVDFEIPYSSLVKLLQVASGNPFSRIEDAVDTSLAEKNTARTAQNKSVLPDYYRPFAMLQEVTKAACKKSCGEITVAHTSNDINEYSVSGFYRVGLALGLISSHDMVPYSEESSEI